MCQGYFDLLKPRTNKDKRGREKKTCGSRNERDGEKNKQRKERIKKTLEEKQ